MKKFFKLAAIAAVAMITVVACKNNKPTEEPVDSTAIETVVEEEMIDTLVAIADTTPVVEEQAAPTVKKVVKKAQETKAEVETTVKDNSSRINPPDPTVKATNTDEVKVDNTVKRTRR